ncbi:hypothetical protein Bca52824_082572 [Brassica carinata]|uniref:Uncharacterized protein n=1 Tax=Brassica carinata TaxID=52824 RepID=A0A8X7TT11_BRACI|nr:hypothetical protein Bca52824_082572 [Brassica carinata]
MAVSLSSSSTITPITLQPKLKPIHGLGTLKFGYLVNSHLPKTRTDVSLRRSAVVTSAITGASETEIPYSLRDCIDSPTVTETADLLETVKVSDLRGNEIPISDLWKDRKAVVAFARHFGCGIVYWGISDEAEKEMEEEEELLLKSLGWKGK